jgi:SAM-dependent methyltransferase
MDAPSNQDRLFHLQVEHHARGYDWSASNLIDPESEETTAGMLLHWLVLDELKPLWETEEKRRFLTVGDGRALEARFLKSLGHQVVASDVCGQHLARAKELSYIDDYLELNAEKMALPDESFDFVLAKETLHHLQRPPLGVYEMLRVAKRGIVLLEPHQRHPSTIRSCLRQIVRRLLRREGSSPLGLLPRVRYEPSGNYLFRFTPFELTQYALALGMPMVAFRYIHRIIDPEHHELKGPELRQWLRRHKRRHDVSDLLNGQQHRALLCFVIMKSTDEDFRSRLKRARFHIPSLKVNPRLQEAA